ncbi:MAG: RNA polymerase sigma factor (sigma-70 family) [Planctomycetota bacterium]|jgi:RNA polymerase sigma factor (sigma-70 family)
MPRTIETESTQTSHEADLSLVRDLLAGDRQSIRIFVDRMKCVPSILRAQNQRLGSPLNREDLLDVVQESLTVVWRKLDSYAGRATIETWAYRFCFLELMNGIRKHRKWRGTVQSEAELESLPAPKDHRGFEFEFLHRGLEHVGPPESNILRMKHFEELTFNEIAERLGVSANTVKTQYYRGLTKLKERIDQVSNTSLKRDLR